MVLLHKFGSIEIWRSTESYGFDYWVYGATMSGDPIVCPSLGMAFEKAGF